MGWAEGVEIGTIASRGRPANFCAIWTAVAGFPWAFSKTTVRFSPSLNPFSARPSKIHSRIAFNEG